jgi:imidazolonepropionase-like amidohydrolase
VRHLLRLGCLLGFICANTQAQVPVADLARPPAEARHFIIESVGESGVTRHGESWSWVAPDGSRMGRESLDLRGQVTELDYRGVAGADGVPTRMTIRGITPQGDAGEFFADAQGRAQWRSPADAGDVENSGGAFYMPLNAPIDAMAWFLERLLASPDQTLMLLPAGRAHAVKLTTLELGDGAATRQTIALWAVSGLNTSPIPMWSDAQGRFFAEISDIGWLPEGYAGEEQRLAVAQTGAMAAQSAALAQSLVIVPPTPVAFVHVRLFDADKLRFLPSQTVIVDKGLIVAVGPSAKVKVPAGAKVMDGQGRTLIPGLWDCHMHVDNDYTGPLELSLGVTSVRDPGNSDVLTMDRRTRAAAGTLLFPHVYPSSLIDGKGPYTAQLGNVATSAAEAIALVDKAKERGFTGVKIYGSFDPAWLPATIDEAHKLGLHVHGHIPAGIRPLDAIHDGYDEITHINFIIMQAMPASVVAVSNSHARVQGPGRYAKDVNLDAPAMKGLLTMMANKHIYSDPTMSTYESVYVPEKGETAPAYIPFIGTLPAVSERQFRSGGDEVPKDLTRADFRASWARMVELLGRMHKLGIPIVAGTDGSGIELVRDLEIFVSAGFTPAEALAAATIVPARVVGMDSSTGSIKVGKTADLALVEGDPSRQIGALRQTRVVMLEGKLLDADDLRAAAGFSDRPK